MLTGLLVRHPSDQRAVLVVDKDDYYEPHHMGDTSLVSVYVFSEIDQEVTNLLVEARQRGYNIQALDARTQPWKVMKIPNVRIVGGD